MGGSTSSTDPLLGTGMSTQAPGRPVLPMARKAPPHTGSAQHGGVLEGRLSELQRCLEKGLVSPEECAEARRRLLDEFCLAPSPEHIPRGHSDRRTSTSSWPDVHTAQGTPAMLRTPSSFGATRAGTPAAGLRQRPASPGGTTAAIQEGDFWIGFIRDRKLKIPDIKRTDSGRKNERLTMAELHQFDVSGDRVEEIFRMFDKDEDGQITPDELREGLERFNRKIEPPEGAEDLIKRITWQCRSTDDPPRSKAYLTELEFKLLLQRLRLGELFTPSAGAFQFEEISGQRPDCPVWVSNYSRTRCETKHLQFGKNEDTKEAQDLFFGSRQCSTPHRNLKDYALRDVRWVHINGTKGLDRLTLFRYAVKYHLHPLAVDDIIDNRTGTKLDRYGDHYFLSVDILAVSEPERKTRVPSRVRLHRCNASIFLSQAPECDTIMTILQERSDESSWMEMWRKQTGVKVRPNYELWDRLREGLHQSPPQVMRERRGDFLLYEILDRVMDQLRPISTAYAKRFGHMRQADPSEFPSEWLFELDEVQLELNDIKRSIRPMLQVLKHLKNDPSLDATMYFEDVEDGITAMLEDIDQLQEMCKTVRADHESHREKKMNQTLYVLSVVSVLFLPGQFVTGVYGMNFVDSDGKPGMPELEWEHGYLCFWVLELCLAFIGLTLFKRFTGFRFRRNRNQAGTEIRSDSKSGTKLTDSHDFTNKCE